MAHPEDKAEEARLQRDAEPEAAYPERDLRAEHWAEAAYNEGWRQREARPGHLLNSRTEMRKAWLGSNARAAVLDGVVDEH